MPVLVEHILEDIGRDHRGPRRAHPDRVSSPRSDRRRAMAGQRARASAITSSNAWCSASAACRARRAAPAPIGTASTRPCRTRVALRRPSGTRLHSSATTSRWRSARHAGSVAAAANARGGRQPDVLSSADQARHKRSLIYAGLASSSRTVDPVGCPDSERCRSETASRTPLNIPCMYCMPLPAADTDSVRREFSARNL